MFQQIIVNYINQMTIESGINDARKYGVEFSIDEAKIILPYLKRNKYYVNKNNVIPLLNGIIPYIEKGTLNKIKFLLHYFSLIP